MRGMQEKQDERRVSYLIYALIDPRNEEVRYVGITDDMTNRFKSHLRAVGSRTLKGSWLEDLQSDFLLSMMRYNSLEAELNGNSQKTKLDEKLLPFVCTVTHNN